MRDDRGLIRLEAKVPKVSVPDHWAERKASSQRLHLSAYVADEALLLVAVGPTLPEPGDGPTPNALTISCPDLSEAYRIAREHPIDVLVVPPDVALTNSENFASASLLPTVCWYTRFTMSRR